MFLRATHEVSVADLARPHHGIVTFAELDAAGYSESEIRTMVDKGYLHRLRRGVFAVGHLALGDDARRMAMVRCAGDGAALTQFSAGACWQITRRHDHVVEIVVPRDRHRFAGVSITVDTRLPSTAFTRYRNTPILTPTWTIVSLARRMGPGSLTRVLREASYRRILDSAALYRISDTHDRRPGIVTLRKALDLRTTGSSGYASNLERAVNRRVRRHAARPPLPNVMVAGRIDEYEVDMVWRELGICAEIDGPIHDDPDVRREDLARTTDLEAAGMTVFRIHWSTWEADPAAAIADLLDEVERRDLANPRHT